MTKEKGFYDMHQPMSKTQPGKVTERPYTCNGDGHEFNEKGKITNNAGSDYHDVSRKSSGLHGNFSEKDAQIKYLTERGKQGQVVKNYNGTEEQARLHTHNQGVTAYPSRPIDEVYKPATSQNVPPANQVVRPTTTIPENTVERPNQKYNAKKLK